MIFKKGIFKKNPWVKSIRKKILEPNLNTPSTIILLISPEKKAKIGIAKYPPINNHSGKDVKSYVPIFTEPIYLIVNKVVKSTALSPNRAKDGINKLKKPEIESIKS